MSIRAKISKFAMQMYLMTPFARFFMGYRYMMTPAQLIFLCETAKDATAAGSNFIEIGCAYGDTCIFINKYLRETGHKVRYKVIDTFEGFERSDVQYEIEQRGISPEIKNIFASNDVEWFRKRMKLSGLDVKAYRMNACDYDFSDEELIAFCLLDIDLYLPTKRLLPVLYERLAEGGVIVVDDCDERNPRWNGAYQAYMEFVGERRLTPEIKWKKLGMVRKGIASKASNEGCLDSAPKGIPVPTSGVPSPHLCVANSECLLHSQELL